MSEKISIMMKNLWMALKFPNKNLYGFLFFSLLPNIFFISKLIFDLHWSVSVIGWFSFIPIYYHIYRHDSKYLRSLLYKNDVFIWCRSDSGKGSKPYWQKVDKRFLNYDYDNYNVYVNIFELYKKYDIVEKENINNIKDLDIDFLKSVIKLDCEKFNIQYTEEDIFIVNNREEFIDNLLKT